MRLTRLELVGFKSFARKTELTFSGGITAVIGPNGSGKSNISDAIRWVLGEQSARALRGTKMEDVIFNGTEQRKSVGYCEVVLSFDNSDGLLQIPYSDVSISRRLYRDGESEYYINRNLCRLKDVQDLFRDTGIGKDGYSIIGQGKVDEILSNKSNERRSAIEEAAGIMRYRVRKEEAERKLENTEKNLVRLEDIIAELSQRIGPLEIQSEIAHTYLKLYEELKDLEINQFLYTYDKTHDRLLANENLISQINESERKLGEESEKLLESISKYEERYHEIDTLIGKQQNCLLNNTHAIEEQKGAMNLLSERKSRAVSDIKDINGRISLAEQRISELDTIISNTETDSEKEKAIAAIQKEIAEAESSVREQDQQITNAEKEIEALKTRVMEAMNKLADTKSDLSKFQAMEESLNTRLQQISVEDARFSELLSSLNRENRENNDKLQTIQKEKNKAELGFKESSEMLETFEEKYRDSIDSLHSLEQEFGQLESRQHLLKEMIDTHEGYYNSVRSILQGREKNTTLKNSVIGVVAELLDVPKELEIAVNMALGSALQNIVTPNADNAQDIIDYLRSNDFGRATLLPLTLIQAKPVSKSEREYIVGPGCIGLASDLVSCDDSLNDLLIYLLGHTVIVKDLPSGIDLKKRSGNIFQIATLEGDIISNSGAMTGGSIRKNDVSLLGREREVKELSASMKEKRKQISDMKEQCEQYRKSILQANIQVDGFRKEISDKDIELARVAETAEIIQRDIDSNSSLRFKLEDERNSIKEKMAEIQNGRQEALTFQNTLESGSSDTQEDILRAQALMNELRQKKEESLRILSEQKINQVSLQKERDAIYDARSRYMHDKELQETEIIKLKNDILSLEALSAHIEEEMEKLRVSISSAQDSVNSQEEEQKKLEEEKLEILEAQMQCRKNRESSLDEMRSIVEKRHKMEISSSRIEMELNAMQDRIWEEYELTYENAVPYRHDFAVGASQTRIMQIRNDIRELGDVNVGAIEDYKNVSERFRELSLQRDDLRKAQNDLNQIVAELVTTMKNVFSREFAVIQKNFNAVFAELFGGGYAELKLSDQNDVLNSDIDIIAQPPGKKLQLLSLLSGGERALTAIALLFAMLKLKPPAFCVLDEIESSLDEANVVRFAQYIKNYTDSTQFILITHRKGSMEVCDTLYGVSMEERGVSKIVSAKFEEVSA